MISNTVRHAAALLLWILITAIAVVANLWAIAEHYLSAKNALELAGTEQQPLYMDPLLGSVIGAFIPNATLPQAIALTIALVEALVLLIAVEEVFALIQLAKLRAAAVRANDEPERREASFRLAEGAAVLVLLAVPLVYALEYDMRLFQFRALAGAAGIEDPTQATELLRFDALEPEALKTFGIWLAQHGAVGYLAFTLLGCLVFKRCLQRTGDQFAFLVRPVDEWIDKLRSGQPDDDFRGYDSSGNPVFDDETRLAYDRDGQPLPETSAAEPDAAPVTPAPEAPTGRDTAGPAAEPPIFEPIGGPTAEPRSASTPPSSAEADLRDVVGGPAGLRVTVDAALGDPRRFHVDRGTGRVWDRAYWDALHAPDGSKA